MLKPYEYTYVTNKIKQLIDIYKTVSDLQVVETNQMLIGETLNDVLGQELHDDIKPIYLDKHLTNEKAKPLFARLKSMVTPFEDISDKQIEKTFKKVKKLKLPVKDNYDFTELNYLAWDDIGSSRKYIIFRKDNELFATYGVMSSNVSKGLCAICHQFDNVSMYMATTKKSGDGTYTKKGNYICKDSHTCNLQMESVDYLYDFYEIVKK